MPPFFFHEIRCEAGDHFGEQGVCPIAVVAAEIADIDIERDGADFRPGMDGEMRFGENDGAGHAGRLPLSVTEGMEQSADHGQAVVLASVDAIRFQAGGIEQEARGATAVMQVGDQVQSVHAVILFRST